LRVDLRVILPVCHNPVLAGSSGITEGAKDVNLQWFSISISLSVHLALYPAELDVGALSRSGSLDADSQDA